ncbi:MAG: YggT family protein [Anaerolineae bacterium]
MIVQSVMRAVDIFFGVVGLLLILRVLLQVFGMRGHHPVLRVIIALTDPVLSVTDRLLGIPSYRSSSRPYSAPRSDMLSSLAALVVLWAGRTLVVWALALVLLMPQWVADPLGNIQGILQHLLGLIFEFYGLALFVRILFSWIRVPYASRIMRFLWNITEPVLAPLRRALPPLGGIDLSPLVAFFLLRLLQQMVFSMLSWIF